MGRKLSQLFILLLWCSVSLFAQQTLRFSEPDNTYQDALKLFQKGKYRAAQTQFVKYLDYELKNIKSSNAVFYDGICALYLGQPNAEQKIQYFVENNSEHLKAGYAYYELGNYYYKNKKYDKSIEYYEEVDVDILTEEQKNDMRFKMAYAYFSKKEFDRAKQLFDRVKTKKHKYQSAAYYYSGYISYEKGNYDDALSNFREIKDDPAYKKVVEPNIAKILYKKEAYDEVITLLGGKNVKGDLALYVAESYYFKGDYKNALKYYETYFARRSTTKDEVNYRMAYTLLQAKEYAKAVDYFKKSALRDDELGQNSAYNLGICYLKTGNKNYALGAFLHASDLDFSKTIQEEALVAYAKINYENKNYAEAISTLNRLNKEFPNSKHYKENEELITDAYLNSNNYKQALVYLESISSISYKEKKAYQQAAFKMGVKEYNAKNYKSGIDYFNKSLTFPIDKNFVLGASYWIGESYSIGKKYDKAKTYYARVFENDPLKTSEYYLKTRYGIGYAYYNTKAHEKALTHFKYYIASEKDKDLYYYDAMVRLADCYYVTKDYNAAISNYSKVKQSNKIHKEYVTFQLGVMQFIQENYNAAKQNFSEIINQYPKSTYLDDALYQRASCDLQSGAYAAAVAGFTDVIDKKPNSSLVPHAYMKRTIAYGNLGRHQDVLKDYEYILDNHITHPVAYKVIEGLPGTLSQLGKDEDFKKYLNAYKAANPMADDLKSVEYESAKALYYAERFKSAITNLEDFIKAYPNTSQAYEGRYLLADAYRKDNQPDKAIENYEIVISDNKTNFVIRAISKVSDLYYAKEDYSNAAKKYEQLMENAQRDKDVVKGMSGAMRSYYHLKDFDNAISIAQKLQSNAYANEFTKNEAILLEAKSEMNKGNHAKAIPQLKRLTENSSDEYGAEANYLLALEEYNAQKYQESKDLLYALNKKYGTYDYWLGKSFVLIAKNLIAMEEIFQAKATLNSVIEHSPIQEIVDEAKAELQKLESDVEREKEEEEKSEEEEVEIEPETETIDE